MELIKYKGWEVEILKASVLESERDHWAARATKPLSSGHAMLRPLGNTVQGSYESVVKLMEKLIDEVSQ